MGRPSKYSDAIADSMYDKLANNEAYYTVEELAIDHGIDVTTFYDWKHKYPYFSNAIKNGLKKQEGMLSRKLVRGDGHITGLIFLLKNKFSWADRIDQRVNANVTISDLINDHSGAGNRADWDRAGGVLDTVEEGGVNKVKEWES